MRTFTVSYSHRHGVDTFLVQSEDNISLSLWEEAPETDRDKKIVEQVIDDFEPEDGEMLDIVEVDLDHLQTIKL